MKEKRDFNINLMRLEYGNHHFNYVIDDSFFSFFEQDLIEKGLIKTNLELIKGDALIELTFNFDGKVLLTCDRSLKQFDYAVDFERKVFLKFGEEYLELNDELIQIPSGLQEFNIAQLLFEFVTLGIPAKKIHPDFDEEEDFFFTTDEEDSEEKEDSKENQGEIDPRWKELLKLKGKQK